MEGGCPCLYWVTYGRWRMDGHVDRWTLPHALSLCQRSIITTPIWVTHVKSNDASQKSGTFIVPWAFFLDEAGASKWDFIFQVSRSFCHTFASSFLTMTNIYMIHPKDCNNLLKHIRTCLRVRGYLPMYAVGNTQTLMHYILPNYQAGTIFSYN